MFAYDFEENFSNGVGDGTSKHQGGMRICMYLAKLGRRFFDFEFAVPMVWKFILDLSNVIVYYCKSVGLRRSLGVAEVINVGPRTFLKQIMQIE